MVAVSWPRTSYEARLLLVPLDRDARAWLTGRGNDLLAGITLAEESLLPSGDTAGPSDPVGRAVSTPLDHAVHDADLVVMLSYDLAAVDGGAVIAIADTARPSGTLVGAVVVSPGATWNDPAAARAITMVRETVDNIVILKDDRFVAPFLQVLRGGVQDGDAPVGVGSP